MTVRNFILASGSQPRKMLLQQIDYEPKLIDPADIDETTLKFETPTAYVKRMAKEKALAVAKRHPGEVVLACDTVVVVGNRVLHKSKNPEEQTLVMKALSGKAHKVLSAVCVVNRDGKLALRCVATRLLMKKMTEPEIKDYVDSNEWVGCCGYKIEGRLAAYVKKIVGSYSGVVGLPLWEARNLLEGAGVK